MLAACAPKQGGDVPFDAAEANHDRAGALWVGHHFEILGAQPAFEPPRRILPDAREERGQRQPDRRHRLPEGRGRSEEHTSELQSLMRISYAVFCLKKKKK